MAHCEAKGTVPKNQQGDGSKRKTVAESTGGLGQDGGGGRCRLPGPYMLIWSEWVPSVHVLET